MQHYKPDKTAEQNFFKHNQALKESVKKREISVEQANMLVYQKHKEATSSLVNILKKGKDVKNFSKFCQKMAIMYKEN
jgi:hypothetical protein